MTTVRSVVAGASADGANRGAPQAIQVADRFHLWHNLAEHADQTVAAHHQCLRELPAAPPPPPAAQNPTDAVADGQPADDGRLADRTRRRHQQIQELLDQGKGIMTIARQTGLARQTIRRFARTTDVEQLLTRAHPGSRPSVLDEHTDHPHQRWTSGCRSAKALFTELQARGYRGSYGTVRAYLRPWRARTPAPPPVARPPKARQSTSWILRRDDDLPQPHSFANGLTRDYAAVVNGLTLPHSSGPVEGQVNRIKM
ncbi:MAG: helix-turn-helix domain-containing protein, partial [Dactylosporangium sp.]|nr:helix-turn-helix domain-containing protein [Dactylosporangium sp.]NNJ63834.1 helix-turn-helix domain-containing protein [Dactylosporangium sp.]